MSQFDSSVFDEVAQRPFVQAAEPEFHADTVEQAHQAHEEDRQNRGTMWLWSQWCDTPPTATKRFKRSGGFEGNDINPEYRIKRMTEVFGACGQTWGWTIKERWESHDCAFVRLSIWYKVAGKVYETGDQVGGTDFSRTPDEAYKMAITDAIGKCLASLGLAADIYLGEFDTKYNRPESPAPKWQPKPDWVKQPANGQAPPATGQQGAPSPPAGSSQPPQAQVNNANFTDWREVRLHFGKNKGVPLGSLAGNSLRWYQEEWMMGKKRSELTGDNAIVWDALRASMAQAPEPASQPF